MAPTSMQRPDASTNEAPVRSLEAITASKAERKRRKQERREKRKAGEAARLVERASTPLQDVQGYSHLAATPKSRESVGVDETDIPQSAPRDDRRLVPARAAEPLGPGCEEYFPLLRGVDSDEDGSVDEILITHGAQAALSRASENLAPKRHLQAYDPPARPEEFDVEELSDLSDLSDSDPPRRERKEIPPPRHPGFPSPDDRPSWFPSNITQIYRVDRHGGALSFKELNEITRYRAALETIRRQKWTKYIEAGEARWKLQRILRRLRARPLTTAFHEYRLAQYRVWKERALKSWKRLEKTHRGVGILDETININFRQERIIYETKLGGRL